MFHQCTTMKFEMRAHAFAQEQLLTEEYMALLPFDKGSYCNCSPGPENPQAQTPCIVSCEDINLQVSGYASNLA